MTRLFTGHGTIAVGCSSLYMGVRCVLPANHPGDHQGDGKFWKKAPTAAPPPQPCGDPTCRVHYPLYTLDEARKVLAQEECAAHGHSWDIIEELGVGPTEIVCGHCGETLRVTRDCPPTGVER